MTFLDDSFQRPRRRSSSYFEMKGRCFQKRYLWPPILLGLMPFLLFRLVVFYDVNLILQPLVTIPAEVTSEEIRGKTHPGRFSSTHTDVNLPVTHENPLVRPDEDAWITHDDWINHVKSRPDGPTHHSILTETEKGERSSGQQPPLTDRPSGLANEVGNFGLPQDNQSEGQKKIPEEKKAGEELAAEEKRMKEKEEKTVAEKNKDDAKRNKEEHNRTAKQRNAEQKKLDAEKAAAEEREAEQKRKEEEQNRVAEQRKLVEEEQKRAAEQGKISKEKTAAEQREVEEKRREDDQQRKISEEKSAAEQREAEEKRREEEQQRKISEEKSAAEQREAEERRKEEEQKSHAERKEAERKVNEGEATVQHRKAEEESKEEEQNKVAEEKEAEEKKLNEDNGAAQERGADEKRTETEQKSADEQRPAEENNTADTEKQKPADESTEPGGTEKKKEKYEDSGTKEDPTTILTTDDQSTQDASRAGQCDLFEGGWEYDPEGPLYTNSTCFFIQGDQDCISNGREDTGYLHWKWKPRDCDLPRFDARAFLESFKGQAIGFVGDSLARNQMQSLLCMLAQVEVPIRLQEHGGVVKWFYEQHQVTLVVVWSPYLLKFSQDGIVGSNEHPVLYLDVLDPLWTAMLPDLDIIVLSIGQWYFKSAVYVQQEGIVGCHYCPSLNLTEMGFYEPYRQGLRQVLEKVAAELKGIAIMSTFAIQHFENGPWEKGGECRRDKPLEVGELALFPGMHDEMHDIVMGEFNRIINDKSKMNKDMNLDFLDVTKISMLRADGHPGPYRRPRPFQDKDPAQWVQNDCLHWCLPGPVDTWNQLLVKIAHRYL